MSAPAERLVRRERTEILADLLPAVCRGGGEPTLLTHKRGD